MRTRTSHIVVHCAATPPDMDIGAKTIREWHTDPKPKGRGWSDIGYHYVIRRNGNIENGRHPDAKGAHVKGFNSQSVGICLIGGVNNSGKAENNFTAAQFKTLDRLLVVVSKMYPHAVVVGHRDLDPNKECPSFDVSKL
jgi:N-acetylmuramoyl-L-alanine amidase